MNVGWLGQVEMCSRTDRLSGPRLDDLADAAWIGLDRQNWQCSIMLYVVLRAPHEYLSY